MGWVRHALSVEADTTPPHEPAQAVPPSRAEAAVAVATIAMLAIGVGLAATVADLSMHAGA